VLSRAFKDHLPASCTTIAPDRRGSSNNLTPPTKGGRDRTLGRVLKRRRETAEKLDLGNNCGADCGCGQVNRRRASTAGSISGSHEQTPRRSTPGLNCWLECNFEHTDDRVTMLRHLAAK
jgi:hypothetical protein